MIVIERAFVALCAGFSESVTLTVKLKVPDEVGVPEISPVEALMESPGGREAALIDQVYGFFPPVAVSVAEYAVPTLPAGSDVVVTLGGGMYLNPSNGFAGLVPAGVVTVTLTVPLPAGDVAVIEVAEFTTTPVAAAVPNLTAVAPVKLLPEILTLVPPAAGPDAGDRAVTHGAAGPVPMKYGHEVTGVVSELVDTLVVSDELAEPGLPAPARVALSWSPACTTAPPKKLNVRAVVELGLAKPTCELVVVSVMLAAVRLLRLVPAGKTMVTVLPAAADRPPVADALKVTV